MSHESDVLIAGGGFAGAFCARALERRNRRGRGRVWLVAPDNFLTFTPLLSEASAGSVEPRHAVVPLREMLPGTELMVGRVCHVDADARTADVVDAAGERDTVRFGQAVVATGADPVMPPIAGLAEHAQTYTSIEDVMRLRNRVLTQLEAAEACDDPIRRRELATITVVGGGYAGVEAVAELTSLARTATSRYQRVRAGDVRVVLAELTDQLMPGLDTEMAAHVRRVLEQRGVDVRLETSLASCADHCVELEGTGQETYRSGIVVWAAGNKPDPLPAESGLPVDDDGRLQATAELTVPGHPHVFAAGDVAAVPDPDGGTCPPTAQHALRQAHTVAANVVATRRGQAPAPFDYRSQGFAVPLADHEAALRVRGRLLTGALAWWLARSYYLLLLPGASRKARVAADWVLSEVFPRDTAQLGSTGGPQPPPDSG